MNKILVVGQTPPPLGGQAVMIQHLVDADYTNAKIFHVRMVFSRGMKDREKIQLYKIIHLIDIIIKIYYYRIFKGVSTLYYPPSGANSGIYRDLLILFPCRWLFRKTIFHFHASGLSQHYDSKNAIFKFLFRTCFFYPDMAIMLSKSCPNEGGFIKAKKCLYVPNGLPDEAKVANKITSKDIINILFIGVLEESKGELDLIHATKLLKERGIKAKVTIAGEFNSIEYRNKFYRIINELDLNKDIEYLGIIKGDEKRKAFQDADVFCFPSFFHSESFPLVLIEAMSYGLPIVTTRWRGIIDMVVDKYNGYLINIKSPQEIAEKIEYIYHNKEMREYISNNSRTEFEKKYSIQQHLKLMDNIFSNIL